MFVFFYILNVTLLLLKTNEEIGKKGVNYTWIIKKENGQRKY